MDVEPITILFSINGDEKLRINENGFYVNGELVEDSKEVYHQFKDWLSNAKEC